MFESQSSFGHLLYSCSQGHRNDAHQRVVVLCILINFCDDIHPSDIVHFQMNYIVFRYFSISIVFCSIVYNRYVRRD